MGNLDLLHIKISGVGDDGFTKGEMRLGFWDKERQDRVILDIPTFFKADLESSLGDVRELIATNAAHFLREVADLIGSNTAEDLQEMATAEKGRQDDEAKRAFTSSASPPA